jgi:hypothetical protein
MLPIFLGILAALGAAIAFRGRWARGLLVIAAVAATEAALFAATGRWGWTAFCVGADDLCAIGLVLSRREP